MAWVPSFRKISYLLRPSKQVERKLILETLHRLADIGYPIRDYRYVGFGSIFFADFRLLHRYLYIRDMLCVEATASPREMLLNRPYEFIDLEFRQYSSVLPMLDSARPHVVWLDFDNAIDQELIDDLVSSITNLARGSVLIVTVRAQPPRARQPYEQRGCHETRKVAELARLNRLLRRFGLAETSGAMSREKYAGLMSKLLAAAIRGAVLRRPGGNIQFHQLFNYRYADGDQMYTIGGLLDSTYARRRLRKGGILDLDFVTPRLGAEPREISVPILTNRERVYLDQHLASLRAKPGTIFGLDAEGLTNYAWLQRHYPSFTEELL
jgi:hypothetical protein